MTTLKTIIKEENIEEKIDTICRQADQYQINAGYPVGIPAKTIILSLFTSAMQRAYEAGAEERDTYWKERVRGEWYIGKKLHVFGGVYEVVGLSTMRDKCEGEPEWEITHEIQEVAIAEKHEGITYQKPSWHKVSELKSIEALDRLKEDKE